MAIRLTGIVSGMDTESMIQELVKVERTRVETVEKEKTKLEWKKEIWQEMNQKLYDFYSKTLSNIRLKSTLSQKKVVSSDSSVATISGSASSIDGLHALEVTKLAKGSYLTGSALSTDRHGDAITTSTTADDLIDFGGATSVDITLQTSSAEGAQTVTIESTDSVKDILTKLKAADSNLNTSFDTTFNRIFLSTKSTGADMAIDFSGTDTSGLGDELLASLGFNVATVGSAGQDAEFNYNGTDLTSSTNDVKVNGLTLQLTSVGTTNITVSQDVDAIYESIKEFVTEYNALITEMNLKINADSATDYEPLTSDEKAAMTDDEIELWEDTIKDSLLKGDDILEGLTYSMRMTLTGSSGVDTDELDFEYLAQLGIVTGDYSERGLLHIEGDLDDSDFALYDNKLREAIENDADSVVEFFNAIGQTLYDNMSEKMASTDLSSAMTFFNDKDMDERISEYEDKILDLEDYLVQVEERYYAQFAAMEQAMQLAQQQSAWLTSQLGGM